MASRFFFLGEVCAACIAHLFKANFSTTNWEFSQPKIPLLSLLKDFLTQTLFFCVTNRKYHIFLTSVRTQKRWKCYTQGLQDYFCHCWWENCSVSLLFSLLTSANAEMPKANHSMADQRSWRWWHGSTLKLVAWTAVWTLPKSIVEVLGSGCRLHSCETEEQESVYGHIERK